MPDKAALLGVIENAATIITPYWPLKTFIATNPLAGLEEKGFETAIESGKSIHGGNGLPTRAMLKGARDKGLIDLDIVRRIGREQNSAAAEILTYPDQNDHAFEAVKSSTSALDTQMIKWLSAFLDEGQAGTAMPYREDGFYSAFTKLAAHDNVLNKNSAFKETLKNTPAKPLAALSNMLAAYSDDEKQAIIETHLTALPGWSGYVKWRSQQSQDPWQAAYPITLAAYIAVRFLIADALNIDISAKTAPVSAPSDNEAPLIWLKAWEETYRETLTAQIEQNIKDNAPQKGQASDTPSAQFIFCIDVRSEVFRRYLERTGNYETYGFAGFFGIPVSYSPFGTDHVVASCPVLLQPRHHVNETAHESHKGEAKKIGAHDKQRLNWKSFFGSLKNNVASPFALVETSGIGFGGRMIGRTLLPSLTSKADAHNDNHGHDAITPCTAHDDAGNGISLEDQIFYAEAGLRVMGLTENFAPLVVLTGHGGETVNNPYASGLDCGACGGNHGGANAKIMAQVYNNPQVRKGLAERGLNIPDDTYFVAALHNTTTDTLRLFNHDKIAAHQPDVLASVLKDLETTRLNASGERAKAMGIQTNNKSDSGICKKVETRAKDWAQVRPEWGLARNAAFIVGNRRITKGLDLEGRTFLHSYNWQDDKDGTALEIILTAPMVVAQWINSQYYFSTVDNNKYGSGSKVTHNVTGKIGVMQGNGSDLMTGLPLQSLMRDDNTLYHEPLRLMCVVHAPMERVSMLIERNEILQTLFNGDWVALTVIDPVESCTMRYRNGGHWDIIGADKQALHPSPQKAEKIAV